ncbi:hypothetical protein EBU94_00260 [bacterium]|nr:hypothetical protein [bacterium]
MGFINNVFRNWYFAFREFQAWLFIMQTIKKHKKTADWAKFNLRADYVGRIYTVLNPELPGDKGDTKEVLALKYSERLKPINLYIYSLGLGPYVRPAYEEIKESDSYLIVYVPIFVVITTWRVLYIIILLTLLIYNFSFIVKQIIKAWNYFF